jgi:hypothetical protein
MRPCASINTAAAAVAATADHQGERLVNPFAAMHFDKIRSNMMAGD